MQKLKIALIGYGKMGKELELIAAERGHEIFLKLDNERDWLNNIDKFVLADIAIDFSTPEKAVDNIHKCFDAEVPVVVGTTGWYLHLNEVINWCNSQNQSLFYAPNYSIGMNIMFRLNETLASLSEKFNYQLQLKESHHLHKKDLPSGTAIRLADDILKTSTRYKRWTIESPKRKDELPIEVLRAGEITGLHQVYALSSDDVISLTHEAFSRRGFAFGAIAAAEFLYGKKGVFTMKDLIGQL